MVYVHGLIELSNGHVAVSRRDPNYISVDPLTYRIITTIKDEIYIPIFGPLCAIGNDSFIYVSVIGGCLCVVSMINGEYKITFKTKKLKMIYLVFIHVW